MEDDRQRDVGGLPLDRIGLIFYVRQAGWLCSETRHASLCRVRLTLALITSMGRTGEVERFGLYRRGLATSWLLAPEVGTTDVAPEAGNAKAEVLIVALV